jgi:hypothetical protein
MPCKSCHSLDQSALPAEINIHPPRRVENLDKPTVWAFPSMLICSNCGFVEFVLSEAELDELRHKNANYWEPGARSFGT